MSTVSKGLQGLRDFMTAKSLSVAELHRGLRDRFGDRVKYTRVLSWKNGDRKPGPECRGWLREACGIPEDDWLSPEELQKKKWRDEGKTLAATVGKQVETQGVVTIETQDASDMPLSPIPADSKRSPARRSARA